jgi:cell division protein FtsW (lipid II flippase)
MDEENKKKFKTKFYFLAVQLNAVILFFALAVIMFFIGPGQFRIPLIFVMIIIALLFSLNFIKKYKETKLWLDEHGGKGKDT